MNPWDELRPLLDVCGYVVRPPAPTDPAYPVVTVSGAQALADLVLKRIRSEQVSWRFVDPLDM